MQHSRCRVLIAGAGPSGLAAALMCLHRGWTDIVLVERRADPHRFERGKAFNYQLDGRGQAILEQIDVDAARLRRYGLPNDHFRLTQFAPDGSAKTSSPPILMADRKTPYWMTRQNLLKLLQELLAERNPNNAVKVLYGHMIEGLGSHADGTPHVTMTGPDEKQIQICADLILGCDGLGSRVRQGLQHLLPEADFGMSAFASPSAGLKYKVLSLPPNFPVDGHDAGVSDHEMAYAFGSTYKDKDKRLALFALPVPSATENRNMNIILPPEHQFWTLSGAEDVMRFLSEGFPQLPLKSLVTSGEAEAFASGAPGAFPEPQYANCIHAHFSEGSATTDCLLIGDAAHAFPPDLGMGVNSALEDLRVLNDLLDEHEEQVAVAAAAFAKARLPENQALVRLVKSVHPYQYNQTPWRLKLWMLKFVLQLGISKVTRGRVGPPGFVLSQHHRMGFVDMERRKHRADAVFYGVALLLATGVALGVRALV